VSGWPVSRACPFGRDLLLAVTAGFLLRSDLQRDVEACDGVSRAITGAEAHALRGELEAGDFFQRHQSPGSLVLESGDFDLEEAAVQICRGNPHRRAPRIQEPAVIAATSQPSSPGENRSSRRASGFA
jgi:hypothetical protein